MFGPHEADKYASVVTKNVSLGEILSQTLQATLQKKI